MYVTREVWGMSCLHKEPLQVRLEWLRLPGRQIPWDLWAVLSAADGQKGSLPGGINQQLYWTLISPWNNGCVCSGCCLALVVLCQELRRADRVRTRDWTEILSEGSFLRVAVQGPLQAGCLKLSTRHCTSQSGFLFSLCPDIWMEIETRTARNCWVWYWWGKKPLQYQNCGFHHYLPIFKCRLLWHHVAAELLL